MADDLVNKMTVDARFRLPGRDLGQTLVADTVKLTTGFIIENGAGSGRLRLGTVGQTAMAE